MTRIPWSDKEVEVLTKLVGAGYTIADIISVFPSRTHVSIKSKMQSLGLTVRAAEPEIDMERFNALMKGVR